MKVLALKGWRYGLAGIVLSVLTGFIFLFGQVDNNTARAQVARAQKQAARNAKVLSQKQAGLYPNPYSDAVERRAVSSGTSNSQPVDDPSLAPTATFTNATPITIPTDATIVAAPYSSDIAVTGQTGVVSNVSVTLNNFSHTFVNDVSVLLVGPTGQKVLLFAQAGDLGTTTTSGVNLTFDDAATAHLPQNGAVVTGTYKPASYAGVDGADVVFPAPAPQSTPASPYHATLQTFNQATANGTWSLYVVDNFDGDGGSIAGGWTLNITTTTTPLNRSNQFVLFEGALTANDAAQTGRLFRSGGGFITQTDNPTVCPGTSGAAALVYDTYSITNQNTVAVPVTVTTTSACGVNVFGSAYSPAYTAASGVCTNYLADAGLSPSATSGIGTTFSFTMTPGQTVQLVANNIAAGTYCADYSLLVEGKIVNPTAAQAEIAGIVTTSAGRGLRNATVTVTNSQGTAQTVRTNSFGRFSFSDLEGGQTYVVNVSNKPYRFSPQVINLTQSFSNLSFVAENSGSDGGGTSDK